MSSLSKSVSLLKLVAYSLKLYQDYPGGEGETVEMLTLKLSCKVGASLLLT